MNLKEEAMRIAKEAFDKADGRVHAEELVEFACDNHEVCRCAASAIKFCTEHDTSEAVRYLEECEGGVANTMDHALGFFFVGVGEKNTKMVFAQMGDAVLLAQQRCQGIGDDHAVAVLWRLQGERC